MECDRVMSWQELGQLQIGLFLLHFCEDVDLFLFVPAAEFIIEFFALQLAASLFLSCVVADEEQRGAPACSFSLGTGEYELSFVVLPDL